MCARATRSAAAVSALAIASTIWLCSSHERGARWAIRCESIPGLIAITAQSDLIATIPKSLLALGIADRLLEPIRVRERMASSTMSLFIKRDSPANAAAGKLIRLIKEEAKHLRAAR